MVCSMMVCSMMVSGMVTAAVVTAMAATVTTCQDGGGRAGHQEQSTQTQSREDSREC
jgi:hypothetical protein